MKILAVRVESWVQAVPMGLLRPERGVHAEGTGREREGERIDITTDEREKTERSLSDSGPESPL